MAASLTQVLAETTNGETISYLYGLGLVAQSMNGVTEYNLTDGLGSVRQLTDAAGSILLSQTFDPYGNRYEQARGSVLWDAASPFGWTGEQTDANGLVYLRARYYQPSMGRFTQLDPFAGALAVPSSLNGYAYGHGNPVMYTDPEGLCGPLCWAAIAVGLVGLGVFAWDYGSQVNYNMQQGMDFGTAVNPANVNWQRSAMYGLLAAGATAGIICYFSLPCALAVSSVLTTVGPYAEAAFYTAGIYGAITRLPGASRLGLKPVSDEFMMDWAAWYMVGLQTAPWPTRAASIEADTTTTALAIYDAEQAALSKAISEGNWAYFAPNYYVTPGGTAITRAYVEQVGLDAALAQSIGLERTAQIRYGFDNTVWAVGRSRVVAFQTNDIGNGVPTETISISGKAIRPGTVGNPTDRVFKTITTQEGNPRLYDAEVKLLEDLAIRLSPNAQGTINMFVEIEPCLSCSSVIVQFRVRYPDVNLNVTWGPPR